jgi:hypothetical protein
MTKARVRDMWLAALVLVMVEHKEYAGVMPCRGVGLNMSLLLHLPLLPIR